MSTLEKVIQMKQQGMPEWDIIQSLKQEGISPREINDALSQSNIKQALNNPNQQDQEMQPSLMSSQPREAPEQVYSDQISSSYQPSTENYQGQDNQQQYAEPYQQQPDYYPEYQPQQPVDVETITDIADQIFEEKNEKIKRDISSITRFKEETSSDLERIEQRLKKLETGFESLQLAILKKIGDYGEDIKNISREMHETQNSFSKIIDPLTENIRERQTRKFSQQSEEHPEQEDIEPTEERKISRKREPGFEDYLR